MGIKLSLNTLYWPNISSKIVESHKSVMKHFGFSINYCTETIDHSEWMQQVVETSDADIVGLIDIDCVPIVKSAIPDMVKYAYKNKTMSGLSQIANHLSPMTHMYVSGACMFIYKPLWLALDSPSFLQTQDYEPSEYVTTVAENNGVRPKTLFPTSFEKEPVEGVWRHSSYGLYGIGTVYGKDQFYHLFQVRMSNHVELFEERCKQIIDGTFDSTKFYNSLDFDYPGKICCFPQELKLKEKWIGKI